jgi:hypothetical protein
LLREKKKNVKKTKTFSTTYTIGDKRPFLFSASPEENGLSYLLQQGFTFLVEWKLKLHFFGFQNRKKTTNITAKHES